MFRGSDSRYSSVGKSNLLFEYLPRTSSFPISLYMREEIKDSEGDYSHHNTVTDTSNNRHDENYEHRGNSLHRIGEIDVLYRCEHLEADNE